MSGRAVKISEGMFEMARREADVMSRSINRQIEHWAEIGRTVEQAGCFSPSRVAGFLDGRIGFDDLTEVEATVAADRLVGALQELQTEPSFLERLRRSEIPLSGVIEKSGKLVRVHPDGRIEKVEAGRHQKQA